MATQLSQPLKLFVHGLRRRKELWYCVDLESLSDQLSPVAECLPENYGGWAVIGDKIYWAGGLKQPDKEDLWGKRRASRKLYCYDMMHKPAEWVVVSKTKKLPVFSPHVVAFDGDQICVLAGLRFMHTYDEEDIEKSGGEVYNIKTKAWRPVALNLRDFASNFASTKSSLLMNEKGEPEQVLFYSCVDGRLVFYNLREDAFSVQVHPNFVLDPFCSPKQVEEKGLDCDLPSFRFLEDMVRNTTAMARDSTLYWFTPDLCLYGYDLNQQKWFQSQHLSNDKLWVLAGEDYLTSPFLVDLYNGQFLLLLRTPYRQLGMAFLDVSKSKSKSVDTTMTSHHTVSADPYPDSETLDGMPMTKTEKRSGEYLMVTITSQHTLSVDPHFEPMDGMAMLKNTGSSAMLEQSNPAMED